MQTVKPEIGSNAGNFEAGYGNYGRLGARGAFNIPISAPWPCAWPWCTSSTTAT
jgi:hypothetical protein